MSSPLPLTRLLSRPRKLTCFGLSPVSALVISGLVPTGLPPNIKPYWRTVVRMLSSRISGAPETGVSTLGAAGGTGAVCAVAGVTGRADGGRTTTVADALALADTCEGPGLPERFDTLRN